MNKPFARHIVKIFTAVFFIFCMPTLVDALYQTGGFDPYDWGVGLVCG